MRAKNGNRKRRGEEGGRGVDGGQRTGQVLHHRLDSPPPWLPSLGPDSCRTGASCRCVTRHNSLPAAGTPVSRQNCGSPSPLLQAAFFKQLKTIPLPVCALSRVGKAGGGTNWWMIGRNKGRCNLHKVLPAAPPPPPAAAWRTL